MRSGYRCELLGDQRTGEGIGIVTLPSGASTESGPSGVSIVIRIASTGSLVCTLREIESKVDCRSIAVIYRSGTLSSHTVCQIPEKGVYHIPPFFCFCLPHGNA